MKKYNFRNITVVSIMIICFTLSGLSLIWAIALMIQGPQSENYSFSEEPYSLIGEKKMSKVIIVVAGGCISIDEKPDDVEIVVQDYDVDGSWDENNERCKLDKDGCRYQEILFPATQNSTTITLPTQAEQTELTVRSYYKHCGEEWDADWDCACDDECPVCLKAISPYNYENIEME